MNRPIPPASAPARSVLRSLWTLRWIAVLCQALTIYVVTGPMAVDLPRQPLWWGVAVLAAFNGLASWRVRGQTSSTHAEVFLHLSIDIVVLSWLVAWSGGVENPFSSLFLLPIALSVLALPAKWMWATAALSIAGFAISA